MGSKKTTTTSGTKLPEFVSSAGQMATQMGTAIGNREYQAYRGQNRIADLSGNERIAMNLAAGGNGQAKQYTDAGMRLLSAGKTWDQATDTERKAYEEPIFQATTRPAIDAANQSYDTQKRNLGANEALIGAKGGQDAVNLSRASLDKNLNQTTGDITARGRHQAFDAARQQFSSDQDRQRAVGEALVTAGGDVSKLNAQQIQDLLMSGGAERVLRQQGLDYDYGKFLEERDWSVNNLKPLLAALQGTQGGYDQTGVGAAKESGGTFGQIAGLGSSLAGAYFGGGFGGGGAGLPSLMQTGTGVLGTPGANGLALWNQPTASSLFSNPFSH